MDLGGNTPIFLKYGNLARLLCSKHLWFQVAKVSGEDSGMESEDGLVDVILI